MWEAKIPLSYKIGIEQVINCKEETESPRKVRKIHFKAPIKQKITSFPQCANSNINEDGSKKIKLTFSN